MKTTNAIRSAIHGLLRNQGADVTGCTTSAAVLERAGLDFMVDKHRLYLPSGTEASDHRATVRLDTGAVLGVVSPKYGIVQNSDAFGLLDDLGAQGVSFERAGCIDGGAGAWVVGRLPFTVKVGGEGSADEIAPTVIFTTRHDGSGGTRAIISPVRVSCLNQIPAIMRAGQGISLRHSSKVNDRLKEAHSVLQGLTRSFSAQAAKWDRMAATPLTADAAGDYFAAVFPDNPEAESNVRRKAIRRHLMGLYVSDAEHQAMAGQTVWGAFNAVTYYLTHEQPVRGQGAEAAERHFRRVVIDHGGSIGRRALSEATAISLN